MISLGVSGAGAGNATVVLCAAFSIDAERSFGWCHPSCVEVLRGRFVVVSLFTILAIKVCWGLVPVTFQGSRALPCVVNGVL